MMKAYYETDKIGRTWTILKYQGIAGWWYAYYDNENFLDPIPTLRETREIIRRISE